MDIKEILIIVFILIVFVVLLFKDKNHDDLFAADRACRPGMVVRLIGPREALCIGGKNENWVVKY